MVKIQPLETPEPPTKVDLLYHMYDTYGWSQDISSISFLYDYFYDTLVDDLEWFQSKQLSNIMSLDPEEKGASDVEQIYQVNKSNI